MKKVYQDIISSVNGNCRAACLASMLEIELSEVPDLHSEDGNRFHKLTEEFLKSKGYLIGNQLFNFDFQRLIHPDSDVFKLDSYIEHGGLEFNKNYSGINGYHLATVCSPANFKWHEFNFHAVVIDSEFNIVHDPNPRYRKILNYPFAKFIGYNGIVSITPIDKITEDYE